MTLGLAFLAGLVSCISPCVLPVLPVFAGYVASGAPGSGASGSAWRGVGFLMGFLGVFVLLWTSLGLIGFGLMQNIPIFRQVTGALVIGMGALMIAGREPLGGILSRLPAVPRGGPLLLGAGVAVGWTPCIGPTLGAIITLAASGASVASGGLLLVAYAGGLAVPFLLVLFAYRRFRALAAWLARHKRGLEVVSGALIVLVGVFVFSGLFARLAGLFNIGVV
ncbi:MAG: cytochrome c biogenesis CcdA family protein [Candidatus Limnocylindrales bacterium]